MREKRKREQQIAAKRAQSQQDQLAEMVSGASQRSEEHARVVRAQRPCPLSAATAAAAAAAAAAAVLSLSVLCCRSVRRRCRAGQRRHRQRSNLLAPRTG